MKRETKKNTFFIFLFEGNFVQGLRTRKSTLLYSAIRVNVVMVVDGIMMIIMWGNHV
jgi:hypothetical protein